MPVMNSINSIRSAINSVVQQNFRDFELIVVDGNSTDGTKEILLEFREFMSDFRSEFDVGYADALNKGILMAKGDYVLMLAADDYLLPGALECFSKSVRHDTDVWSGSILYSEYYGFRIVRSDQDLDKLKSFCSLQNPATFYKRALFVEYGFFRTDLKCAADREMFLRLFLSNVRFQVEDLPIVLFSLGGLSTLDPEKYGFIEDEKISIEYGMSPDDARSLTQLHRVLLMKSKRREPLKKLLAKFGLLNIIYFFSGRSKAILSRSELMSLGIPFNK